MDFKDKTVQKRIIHSIIAAAAAVMLLSTFLISTDYIESGPTFCYFRDLTGYPCPGCGISRSLFAISHAEFERAWTLHPLSFTVYLSLILIFFAELIYVISPGEKQMSILKSVYKLSIIFYFMILIFGTVRFFWILFS